MVTLSNTRTNDFITMDYDGPYLVYSVDFGTVNVSLKTIDYFKQIASTVSAKKWESRTIRIYGYIIGTPAEMKIRRRYLEKMINPNDTIKVVYDSKYILGEPKGTVKWGTDEEDNNNYMCKFYIELVCVDPLFRSLNMQHYDLSNWQDNLEWPIDETFTDGYFHIPVDNTGTSTKYPVGTEFEVGTPNVVRTVTVNGDIASPLIMTFSMRGAVVDPYFINVITQEKIGFVNATFQTDDIVIIDTFFRNNPITLIREGVTSTIFGWRDKTSKLDMVLEPGINYILYDASSGADNLSPVLDFYDMYLGVQWVC